MAKKNVINYDEIGADKIDFFNDSKKVDLSSDSNNEDNTISKLEKKEKKTISNKKEVSENHFLKNLIDTKNELYQDKSINQVKINDQTKKILDRLKFISDFPISSIADAILLDYYLNNKDLIDKMYKNKFKKNDLF